MPYLMTTSTYPSDKAAEVAEQYLQAMEKYPNDDNLETDIIPGLYNQIAKV